MNAKRFIGLALLVGGIIMLVYGFQAKDSVQSQVSEVFTGTPSDNAKWLLLGGAVCSVAGVVLVLFKK